MTPSLPKPQTSSSTKPCAWSDGPRIRLDGLELIPDLSGALFVPDYSTVLASYRPQRLISLGDSFHDEAAPDRLADDDFASIRELGNETDVTWITGNHDPALPAKLGGRIVDEVALGAVSLRHIPSTAGELEISGHLHPTGIVIRRGRRLRRKCFAGDGHRLIMPAFGAYTGGLNVRSPAISGLFENAVFSVWMLGRKAIHRFGSRSLLGE